MPSGGATGMLDEVDWIGFEASEEVDGSSGLHGEWDPADVLEDAASGTPDDEYRSWLNWKEIKKKSNAINSRLLLWVFIITSDQ